MYYEGAGREVQAAGSSGGSHAEGAEVSPTTEGRTHVLNANASIVIMKLQLLKTTGSVSLTAP